MQSKCHTLQLIMVNKYRFFIIQPNVILDMQCGCRFYDNKSYTLDLQTFLLFGHVLCVSGVNLTALNNYLPLVMCCCCFLLWPKWKRTLWQLLLQLIVLNGQQTLITGPRTESHQNHTVADFMISANIVLWYKDSI